MGFTQHHRRSTPAVAGAGFTVPAELSRGQDVHSWPQRTQDFFSVLVSQNLNVQIYPKPGWVEQDD